MSLFSYSLTFSCFSSLHRARAAVILWQHYTYCCCCCCFHLLLSPRLNLSSYRLPLPLRVIQKSYQKNVPQWSISSAQSLLSYSADSQAKLSLHACMHAVAVLLLLLLFRLPSILTYLLACCCAMAKWSKQARLRRRWVEYYILLLCTYYK